jgi:hypothetical protein
MLPINVGLARMTLMRPAMPGLVVTDRRDSISDSCSMV